MREIVWLMNRDLLIKLKELLLKNKEDVSPINELLSNDIFIANLLEYSMNDIDVFCSYMGEVFVYYLISGDRCIYNSYEEINNKYWELIYNGFDILSWLKNDGVFTHSCNGSMVKYIKRNGLGSSLNGDASLFEALNFLEKKIGITGDYTKQQSGRIDEVYFTAPGATTFGYVCNFAPERLFLGILRQEFDEALNVKYGESKIDYYRRVLYRKFSDVLDDEVKANIEVVLNGFFSESNCIITFPISEVIDSNKIYQEVVSDNNLINLREYIIRNCGSNYFDFFTRNVGSNSNTNNMDNLVMIDTVISPLKLKFYQVPDRYDLIQLIARNKKLEVGDELGYFDFESTKVKNR